MDIGSGEVMLILLFALLLYGGRLPEVARSLGRSIAAVKRSVMESTSSVSDDFRSAMDDADVRNDLRERPRTVRRIVPVPAALATEDISVPDPEPAAAPAQDAPASEGGGDAAATTPPPTSPQG